MTGADAHRPAATSHGSSATASLRRVRAALFGLLLAAAAALLAAEWSTLYEIRVLTAVPDGGAHPAGAHHGYALVPIALGLALMGAGAALGGSRPAAFAVVALALAALGVALLADLPVTDDTGLVGRSYEAARAEPGPALALELAGGGAALAAGLALLALARRRALVERLDRRAAAH